MRKRTLCQLIIGIMFIMGAVSPSFGKEMSAKELQLELKRLSAVNEIENLMSKYAMYLTSGFNHRIPEMFTETDDTVIEMVWGRYTGKDAAYRCYTVDHRGHDQGAIDALGLDVPPITSANAPGNMPPGGQGAPPAGGKPDGPPPGQGEGPPDGKGAPPSGSGGGHHVFVLRMLTTPIIQVAKDCQTARAVWTSPGIAASGWAYMKYGCDFKLVDGIWKIWHLHVYGLFTTDYDKSWGELEPEEQPKTASRSADKPPTTGWSYNKEVTYVPLEPVPPEPYDTWDEDKIVPGSYGVID